MYLKIIYLCTMLLLAVTGFVEGSCLEYGHSCWGAHGKRSVGKIYRSIDGSESQQSEGNRDIQSTQEKVKPNELLSILLERNGRVNLDETINAHDFNRRNNDDVQMFDASEQRLKRKLKDAFRKGVIFHYSPSQADEMNVLKKSTESSKVRRYQERPAIDTNSDYYQGENYPSLNMDMEYLDLK